MCKAAPVIRHNGEGEQMWFAGGGIFTWKPTAADTGGSLLHPRGPHAARQATPLHLHPDQDEALYVLEGELLVDVEASSIAVGRAACSSRRAASPHAFLVTSERAHVLP